MMTELSMKASFGAKTSEDGKERQISYFITLLFAVQPLMDMLSFWLLKLGLSSSISTGLRAFVLLGVLLYTFVNVPDKRRLQIGSLCLFGLFWLLHYLFAYHAGVGALGADLNQYIKTVQLPIFVFCFYALNSRAGGVAWAAFLRGAVSAFWLIIAADSLAWLSGTGNPTYIDLQAGFLGWYYVANAQSIILAVLFPVALFATWKWALEEGKNRDVFGALFFLCTVGIGGWRIYCFATRVTYASMFTTVIALFVIISLQDWRRSFVHLLLLLLLGGAAYGLMPMSPMYQVRANDEIVSSTKQETLEKELQLDRKLNPVEHDLKLLEPIYNYYLSDMVQEFGLDKVAEEYGYSAYFIDLRNVRNKKIHFAHLRMNQMPSYIKWTGLNFASMQVPGVEGSYDLETDPPAIYYYTGYIGVAFCGTALLLLVGGLLYMLFRRGLFLCLKDASLMLQGYLFLLMLAAAATGGSVFRRPSTSIYLAFVWACLLYQAFPKTSTRVAE